MEWRQGSRPRTLLKRMIHSRDNTAVTLTLQLRKVKKGGVSDAPLVAGLRSLDWRVYLWKCFHAAFIQDQM